ncbi:uncharacterized protein BX664DRAFT_329053 [Halteromyces radiatus]|uniref:uncharacterized protein n=1 Tax=Halteromyces radiatus TaxID=101107 RepID=UPI00221E8EAD|nr:uncharacterized protein BX664DRAFT_329053 [Halteromyces radiatus]KAI8093155.1 hypothetical protein BX664DRAFT_329053 [Halteromyces radiatus]
MNNTSSNQFKMNPNESNDFGTILDPQTFNLLTIVGGQVVDTQPLFDKEDGEIVDNQPLDNRGPTSKSSLNVNNNPFFEPKPFLCTLEDIKQLVHMNIPGYLYKVAILKEKQLEIAKEEKESLIPLVLHLAHKKFKKPSNHADRQQYVKDQNRYIQHLLGDVMPAGVIRNFLAKIKRNDEWLVNE